ncbi:MAG TPA: STAS domain-containing protein [Pyrinomonadaceae bacterium]|nr:STAS domain-containing protein [Pyrinomonadaceae bacterium]
MDNLKDWALGVASKVSKVSITERQAGDVIILGVEGNIVTGESADKVRAGIRRLLAEGRRKFLLDMAQVRWVDSIGIGELVSALVSVTRAGGQIKLLKVRENIKEQLSITGIHAIFAIYDDESEALNDYL